jgi:hypothetical protein
MNARIAAVLVLVLAVLGGSAIFLRSQQGTQKPPSTGTLGQPLLKGLKAADVAGVSIRDPKAAITLERKGERWVIAERADFPADLEKVKEFVIKALELKIGQVEPIGEKDRARLLLDASGTAVEFRAADGKPLGRMTVGKKYFKGEPANPDKALGDGRFVMLPDNDKQVYVVADPLAAASTKSADWIAKAGFQAEKVKVLDVKFADGGGYRIERSGDNADWKLDGANAGEKLEVTRANAASYSLSNIDLSDVLAKDAKPETTGLDKPTVVTAETLDGLTYVLKLGKLAGDSYHATLTVSGTAKADEGKDAAERQKRLDERVPKEKALEGHVLLIPKSKLDDTLKPRGELLEKPDPAKDAKKQ